MQKLPPRSSLGNVLRKDYHRALSDFNELTLFMGPSCFLTVAVPVATILGKPEMFVDVGSTINITCIVQHTPGPPSIVQWQHNGHVSGVYFLLFHSPLGKFRECSVKSPPQIIHQKQTGGTVVQTYQVSRQRWLVFGGWGICVGSVHIYVCLEQSWKAQGHVRSYSEMNFAQKPIH